MVMDKLLRVLVDKQKEAAYTMARTKSSNRSGSSGMQTISQDNAKAMELEKWCKKQTRRQTTATLRAATGDQFKAFSNQSLAKKMVSIFDTKFGRGRDGEDEEALRPDDIMESARNGSGLAVDGMFPLSVSQVVSKQVFLTISVII